MEGSLPRVLGVSNSHILARPDFHVKAPPEGAMPRLLGDKLRALRHQHRFTQVELARRLSLTSYTHITKLEAAQRAASLDLILRVAQLFGVTTEYLLRDSLPVDGAMASTIAPILDEETLPRLFGIKLRSLRLRRGLSQTDLERQLELASRTHVNNLEAGRKIPSPELAVQIADLFGVTTDYLLRDNVPVESIASTDVES